MYDYLLLDCLANINGQRSTAAVYHLLKGKRSSQTIQDANLYQLKQYFGIYKQLDRIRFHKQLIALEKKEWITISTDEVARLTWLGIQFLETNSNSFPVSDFKGTNYVRHTDTYALKWQLWVQTYTNMLAGHREFNAITDHRETQMWVKDHFHQHRQATAEWVEGVYQELHRFLQSLDPFYAQLLVGRLTGNRKIGLTIGQLASKHEITIDDVNLSLTVIYHQLMSYSRANESTLSYLTIFLPKEMNTASFMTNSTKKTYQMVNRGYKLEDIMRLRRLKEGTIHDHLVEIAYADTHFNITTFVGPEAIAQITTAIAQTTDRKLTTIKAQLEQDYSYFQIRLVLASQKIRDEEDGE